jgi:hypothetical protein
MTKPILSDNEKKFQKEGVAVEKAKKGRKRAGSKKCCLLDV